MRRVQRVSERRGGDWLDPRQSLQPPAEPSPGLKRAGAQAEFKMDRRHVLHQHAVDRQLAGQAKLLARLNLNGPIPAKKKPNRAAPCQ